MPPNRDGRNCAVEFWALAERFLHLSRFRAMIIALKAWARTTGMAAAWTKCAAHEYLLASRWRFEAQRGVAAHHPGYHPSDDPPEYEGVRVIQK